MKVVMLVRSLGAGGAERQLVNIAIVLKRLGHDIAVVTFYEGSAFAGRLSDAAIPLRSLDKHGRWDLSALTLRLVRRIRSENPTIVYCFGTTANILGALAAPFLPGTSIVWGVRSGGMDVSRYDWVSKVNYWLESALARVPAITIANSEAGARLVERAGARKERIVVVPNGIDTAIFYPDQDAGRDFRRSLGVGDDTQLIGMVTRRDPVKALDVSIAAWRVIAAQDARYRFVWCGIDDVGQSEMSAELARHGLANRSHVLGPRQQLRGVYNALDVHVLCSNSEGSPNVVAEAMACGTPCVVTRVGEAPRIVSDHGAVVSIGDSTGLAAAVCSVAQRAQAGDAALARTTVAASIEDRYSLNALAQHTDAALRKAIA